MGPEEITPSSRLGSPRPRSPKETRLSAYAIVPIRLGGQRFPNKALHRIQNAPMFVHLLECLRSTEVFDDVIVTSDSETVLEGASVEGFRIVETKGAYRSGTERVAEAARILGLDDHFIVNVQGDMPAVERPAMLELLKLLETSNTGCWTLSRTCIDEAERTNPHRVKVVCDVHHLARYFSRAAIPYGTNAADTRIHLGVYGFKPNALRSYVDAPICSWAVEEDLEQLDWLAAGRSIAVHHVQWCVPAVDVPSDMVDVESWFKHHRT